MGGRLTFVVATPVVIGCGGGGTILPAAVFGGLGAWLSGLGRIVVALVAALIFLVVRELRRPANPELSATAIAAALSLLTIWIEFRFALRITVGVFVAVGIYAFFLNKMKSKGATE